LHSILTVTRFWDETFCLTPPALAEKGEHKMAALSLANDTLIFTDRGRLAGGILNRETGRTATMVTSAMIQALEASLIGGAPLHAGLEAMLRKPVVTHLRPQEGRRATPTRILPGIRVTERAPRLGPITTETHDGEGTVDLDGGPIWRPAGTVQSRTVGSARLAFVVANQDLTGKVRPKNIMSATRFLSSGPTIVAQDSTCGVCSSCGACALCTACGELNAAAIGAAAAALTNVAQASNVAFDPADLAGRRAAVRTLSPEATKVLEHLAAICQDL
jgi:hypothetical protein